MVLFVGEVNKNKNHKVGIEALAKLRDKNTYYVICGRGSLMEAYKELAQSLGVGDRVVLERMSPISIRRLMYSCSHRLEKDFRLR